MIENSCCRSIAFAAKNFIVHSGKNNGVVCRNDTVQSVYVPTIIYKTISSTLFHFSNKGTTVQIKALDKPITATKLRGKALYRGIFGFTGEFRGWFSRDEAAVPLKGKLRVILGSIDIELIKWERNN